MQKLIQFIFLIVIPVSSLLAQQNAFIKTYTVLTEDFRSVMPTSDGGFLSTGSTTSFGSGGYDFLVIKTDINGDTIWTRAIGGPADDISCSVVETGATQFLINGYSESFGAGGADIFLVKLDQNGDTLFTRAYGDTTEEYSSFSFQFANLSDGGFMIAATSTTFQSSNQAKIYILRIDSIGNVIWSKTYLGSGSTASRIILNTTNNGIALLGTYRSDTVSAPYKPILMKIDTSGNVLWVQTYSGLNTFQLYAARNTNDGGFILSGYTGAFNPNNHQDFILIKTDSMGQIQWSKAYGNALNSSFMGSAIQTSDGGYVVCGASKEEYGLYPQKSFLFKTNSVGDTLWTRWFGSFEQLLTIEETSDLGFIAVGQYGTLVKTDSLGHTFCNEFPHNPLYAITTTLTTTPVTLQVSPWGYQSMTQSVVMSAPITVTTICSNVGIETFTSPESFTLYPNPATNELTIELAGIETKNATIRIISMLAQIVFEKSVQTNNGVLKDLLDVSQLSEGIYFVEVLAGEKRVVKKVVVQW